MKFFIKLFSLSFLLILGVSLTALAQLPPAPPATPIDGGLSLLLLAGGAYGLKKIRDISK